MHKRGQKRGHFLKPRARVFGPQHRTRVRVRFTQQNKKKQRNLHACTIGHAITQQAGGSRVSSPPPTRSRLDRAFKVFSGHRGGGRAIRWVKGRVCFIGWRLDVCLSTISLGYLCSSTGAPRPPSDAVPPRVKPAVNVGTSPMFPAGSFCFSISCFGFFIIIIFSAVVFFYFLGAILEQYVQTNEIAGCGSALVSRDFGHQVSRWLGVGGRVL